MLSDWKVFYNDGTNVYIILSDYLNNSLIPAATGMTKKGTYVAYWKNVTDNREAVATLTNTSYWSAFAGGNGGYTATGSPTADMLMASYNAKHNTSLTYNTCPRLDAADGLYVSAYSEGCSGYWLASPYADYTTRVWNVGYDGSVNYYIFDDDDYGVRPVVCLTSGITGTVGDAVTI